MNYVRNFGRPLSCSRTVEAEPRVDFPRSAPFFSLNQLYSVACTKIVGAFELANVCVCEREGIKTWTDTVSQKWTFTLFLGCLFLHDCGEICFLSHSFNYFVMPQIYVWIPWGSATPSAGNHWWLMLLHAKALLFFPYWKEDHKPKPWKVAAILAMWCLSTGCLCLHVRVCLLSNTPHHELRWWKVQNVHLSILSWSLKR